MLHDLGGIDLVLKCPLSRTDLTYAAVTVEQLPSASRSEAPLCPVDRRIRSGVTYRSIGVGTSIPSHVCYKQNGPSFTSEP